MFSRAYEFGAIKDDHILLVKVSNIELFKLLIKLQFCRKVDVFDFIYLVLGH